MTISGSVEDHRGKVGSVVGAIDVYLIQAGHHLVRCLPTDVSPACRVSLDHALAQGWINNDEWFAGLLALD